MYNGLYQITGVKRSGRRRIPFCAGLVIGDLQMVTQAAPILRFMLGWYLVNVKANCVAYGWQIVKVEERMQPEERSPYLNLF